MSCLNNFEYVWRRQPWWYISDVSDIKFFSTLVPSRRLVDCLPGILIQCHDRMTRRLDVSQSQSKNRMPLAIDYCDSWNTGVAAPAPRYLVAAAVLPSSDARRVRVIYGYIYIYTHIFMVISNNASPWLTGDELLLIKNWYSPIEQPKGY